MCFRASDKRLPNASGCRTTRETESKERTERSSDRLPVVVVVLLGPSADFASLCCFASRVSTSLSVSTLIRVFAHRGNFHFTPAKPPQVHFELTSQFDCFWSSFFTTSDVQRQRKWISGRLYYIYLYIICLKVKV